MSDSSEIKTKSNSSELTADTAASTVTNTSTTGKKETLNIFPSQIFIADPQMSCLDYYHYSYLIVICIATSAISASCPDQIVFTS
jgi:hypothetical protein